MDNLDMAIENVKQRFAEMHKALDDYAQANQERKKRLRSMITIEEWPKIKSKMKDWLGITQELIDRQILYSGFDEDCVFAIRFIHKKMPRLRVIGNDEPPKLEKLITQWEGLMQYLLSKGYLDRIPDDPAFELRGYVIGVKELMEIVEEKQM